MSSELSNVEKSRVRNRAWYHRNIEAQRKRRRDFYWKDIEASRKRGRDDRNKNLEERRKRNREWVFFKKHGITLAQRDAMLLAQGNKCGACGATDPGNKWGWQLDHNHATNELRKVLCHFCNVSLGHAKDNIDTLKKWIKYLEDHKI